MNWAEAGTSVEAFGAKGHYTIHRAPGFSGCVLTANGHDDLPMLAIPPFGKSFDTLQRAKDYAERIEWVKTPEPQGGAG